MKKNCTLVFTLLFMSICVVSQNSNSSENEIKKSIIGTQNHELKFNLIMAIAGLPELTYERFFSDNSGAGLSVAISLDDSQDFKSIILPYYRLYFGNKKANGFFIEGNMALVTERGYNYIYQAEYSYSYSYYPSHTNNVSNTNFGFGAAVGVKFLTKNNFSGEVYLGAGRNFGNSKSFPRMGITLGKRF